MHKFITPRVGSDGYFPVCVGGSREFQSTLPVWGATTAAGIDTCTPKFQSTLPVWGATKSDQCGDHCPA